MVREFSAPDPKGKMRLATKCERVQPVMVGVDAKGEPVWEGREMPRWQMEMLRVTVDWMGSLFSRWAQLVKYERRMEEFGDWHPNLTEWIAKSKTQIEEMKRQYQRPGNRKFSVTKGD